MVSADEIEKKLLSEEWTEMTELEVEQFLATPGLCTVDLNESSQTLYEDIPELLEEMQGSGLNVGNVEDIAEMNKHTDFKDIDINECEFFDYIKVEDEFVIHSEPKYYVDAVYNHFYTNDFSNDVFF